MSLSTRETAKFGLLVGLCAIFVDAVIAHGLFWDNDPYWTYWITKSFLITTVFIIGTAWFGVGWLQGIGLTLVHTLILEVYYQWLAPVGLPQEPEWLDFNHLWVTGFPVHYLAIFIGYLMAMWISARARIAPRGEEPDTPAAGPLALGALLTVVVVLVLSGIITHGLLLGKFPGITYFVQHLLTGFVFLFIWSAFVGLSGAGWWVGALMLALTWTAYGMYVGPVGLPFEPPHYLGYDQLWLRAFPGDLLSALIGLWIAPGLLSRVTRRSAALVSGLLVFLILVPSERAEAKGMPSSAAASGPALQIVGANPVDIKSSVPAAGSIEIRVGEGGNRWSHVQNMDAVNVVARVRSRGANYDIIVDKAMPRHPLGKYTTWNGVVFNHAMHGDTGIGTSKLPKMVPAISIYGWGRVSRDGQPIATMAPVHVMVTNKGPMQGVMLEVATEDKSLVGVPDGYLTFMWPRIATLVMPDAEMRNKQIAGWVGLLGMLALFGWLSWRERMRA